MGVTAFSAADYLVSLCAQLAMLLSYHVALPLLLQASATQSGAHPGRLALSSIFTTTTQRACCPQASSTAAPLRQASQQALHYRQMMHTTRCCVLFSEKKRVLYSSVPLFYKAPTPEACKDEGPEMAPPKRVVLRYLNAAINNYEY